MLCKPESARDFILRLAFRRSVWPASQAFSFGLGVKKERGKGFSVLAALEVEREPKNEKGGVQGA